MNEIQQIQISAHGAELMSLVADGHEYLWHGDEKFWSRRAPILFPIVGRLAEDTLRVNGAASQMKQHGFARDTEFVPTCTPAASDGTGILTLRPSDEPVCLQMVQNAPISNYPYPFQLNASYAISGNKLNVKWEVANFGKELMYFQIGAHPAFMLPAYSTKDAIHGYLRCSNQEGHVMLPVTSSRLVNGLRHETDSKILSNKQGLVPITDKTFANDAILLECGNISDITLLDKNGHEVLKVSCPQADAFGIWAPDKPGCPFVCIEPWCGIADPHDFQGDISERDCIHELEPDDRFVFEYTISISND